MKILGYAAQYAFQDEYLVESNSPTGEQVIGELSYQDMTHLQDIGIIKSTYFIHHVNLRKLSDEESASDRVKEEMILKGSW